MKMTRTVLIVGASRGIGLELVRQYVEEGDRLIAGCRRPEEAGVSGGLQQDFGATKAALDAMDMMQFRIATLDSPDSVEPKLQVQTAERIGWMVSAHELPACERFPAKAA